MAREKENFSRDRETFRLIASAGMALWSNEEKTEQVTKEAFAAILTTHTPEEQAAERALATLLEVAECDPILASKLPLRNPFFRLNPTQRLVVAALQSGRWSYARLARALQKTSVDIEKLAYAARVQIAFSPEARAAGNQTPLSLRLPKRSTKNCPEYSTERPWVQRILDEESPANELPFLHAHLMACEDCRRALGDFRKIYFAVEAFTPELPEKENPSDRLAGRLEVWWKVLKDRKARENSTLTAVAKAFRRMFLRPDVILAAAVVAGAVYAITRS